MSEECRDGRLCVKADISKKNTIKEIRRLREIFNNKIFQLIDDKIIVNNIEEIQKQAEYYKKMEILEKKRKEKSKTF